MNRNDRRIALAALTTALFALIAFWIVGGNERATVRSSAGDSLSSKSNRRYQPYAVASTRTVEQFPFDPNTADSTQLLRLGLQPWQVRSLYRYRAKGGVFRKKEDFARLYGLTIKDYRRLEPYIRIGRDYQLASTLFRRDTVYRTERDTLRYPVKIHEGEQIVLNTADTTELRKVPGIGAYYAARIIRYGQRLGGYVSVDQLDEIEDFPQEAKKYFVIQDAHPQQLNVNQMTLQQLRKHPYINFYQAKAITDYRRLHGPLRSLDDLRLSKDFPPEEIERLRPYVSF
ncbi:MAG: helix-hairpin-helix domain-containing protein [Prevotella sp.]|nr:helix-hairpin-helix domain-containing protein [Prevotella sp.]